MRVLLTEEKDCTFHHYIASKSEYPAALEIKRMAEAEAKEATIVENYDGTHLVTIKTVKI